MIISALLDVIVGNLAIINGKGTVRVFRIEIRRIDTKIRLGITFLWIVVVAFPTILLQP